MHRDTWEFKLFDAASTQSLTKILKFQCLGHLCQAILEAPLFLDRLCILTLELPIFGDYSRKSSKAFVVLQVCTNMLEYFKSLDMSEIPFRGQLRYRNRPV